MLSKRGVEISTRGGVEDPTFEAKAKDSKKKFEAKAKDRLFEDRPSQCQVQECSRPRPRTQRASVLKKKKKLSSQIFCEVSGVIQDKVKKKDHNNGPFLTIQKAVLSPARGQGIFEDL